MTNYRYMDQWNPRSLRPLGGRPYLSESEARERYERDGNAFDVIPEPASETGVPAWHMRVFTGDGSFKVKHYNKHGATTRVVGFRIREGQLRNDSVIDYFYPDGEEARRGTITSSIITTYIEPDGTSKIIYSNVIPGQEYTEERRGVPVDSYRASRPEFGQWEELANPNYGS